MDHQEAQSEEELLQGLIFQEEWHQGDLQGYSSDQVKSAITKELRQIGPHSKGADQSLHQDGS